MEPYDPAFPCEPENGEVNKNNEDCCEKMEENELNDSLEVVENDATDPIEPSEQLQYVANNVDLTRNDSDSVKNSNESILDSSFNTEHSEDEKPTSKMELEDKNRKVLPEMYLGPHVGFRVDLNRIEKEDGKGEMSARQNGDKRNRDDKTIHPASENIPASRKSLNKEKDESLNKSQDESLLDVSTTSEGKSDRSRNATSNESILYPIYSDDYVSSEENAYRSLLAVPRVVKLNKSDSVDTEKILSKSPRKTKSDHLDNGINICNKSIEGSRTEKIETAKTSKANTYKKEVQSKPSSRRVIMEIENTEIKNTPGKKFS